MIEIAIHPFLVHFLIAAGGLFLLSRIPGRFSDALTPMLRPLSALLLVLFPAVLGSGAISRTALIHRHVAGDLRLLSVHWWMALLTAACWVPVLILSLRDKGNGVSCRERGWSSHPGWWILAAVVLVVTATLGGQLVYGGHGFIFPVR